MRRKLPINAGTKEMLIFVVVVIQVLIVISFANSYKIEQTKPPEALPANASKQEDPIIIIDMKYDKEKYKNQPYQPVIIPVKQPKIEKTNDLAKTTSIHVEQEGKHFNKAQANVFKEAG